MALFVPDLMVNSVTDLTADQLKLLGIKGVLLDVDNTLTTHGHPVPAPGVLDWISHLQAAGISLILVSNNTKERVEPFAKILGLPFVSMGCKPLTFGFTRACKRLGVSKKETMVIGDQVFTDILGGNLKGIYTVLVTPLDLEPGVFFRLKRRLEYRFVRKYQKLHTKKIDTND